MPYFESPALYIDFARLPPPAVIETIDYEALVQIYRDQVVTKMPVLKKAVTLEQSPTNVILESEAYGEMMVRARVNAAARAVMLPFAVGSDLDVLGAFYNVSRNVIPGDPVLGTADTPEGDASFRRRIQLAPEAFTTAGSAGAYIFHATTAAPTLRDASATKINNRGGIKVALMNTGSNPLATEDQVLAVTRRLLKPSIKPLTHVVSVAPATILPVGIKAEITLYPGPDQALVMADIGSQLDQLRTDINWIGRDLTVSAVNAALKRPGVQNVKILSPTADVVADFDQCVWLRSAEVTPSGIRME